MIKPLILSSILVAGSVSAAELGVTNSYGQSFRDGTGVTNIQFNTSSQVAENSYYGAVKLETSSYGDGETTTTTTAPGNGNGNGYGYGNAGSTTTVTSPGGFNDSATSLSLGFGERNYSEAINQTGTTQDRYSFGSTNFSHSVGVFSR